MGTGLAGLLWVILNIVTGIESRVCMGKVLNRKGMNMA
jgi:hypothetical protein